MKIDHLFLLLLWAAPTLLSAQYEAGTHFGEITVADRQLSTVPGDSAATAYVLYDHLDLAYRYNDQDGPSLYETFHRRIKLLQPAAFDLANVTIPYRKGDQEIENLRAIIHLPQGGALPVGEADFVRDQDSDGSARVKFTFPRVTAGAIIEFTYTRSTDNILAPTVHYFQESIPVRWSEYTAVIPPYYQYMSLGNVRGQYHIQEAEIVKQDFGPDFGSAGPYRSNGNRVEHSKLRWVMRDLPAFTDEPYTNNASDYLPRIWLQLQSVGYPGQGVHPVFSDWQETVNTLQDRPDFGRYYRNRINYGKLWKEAEATLDAAATAREKIEAAYRFVLAHVRWNGDYHILASQTPNQILAEGTGNSADLNMCLLALLNEAGITAHPLLVSLRDHGAPIEVYPVIYQFDHLMVYTEVDGQALLLDVNDSDRPAGLPRIMALNHRGWVADKDDPRWIDLVVPPARRTIMQDIRVGEDGMATVEIKSRMESYFAFDARSTLHQAKQPTEAPLANEILARYPETEVLKPGTPSDKDEPNGPLDYYLQLRVPAMAQVYDDYLYVQPFLLPVLDAELDDVDERVYPIDFAFPWQQRFMALLHVPAGYVLDEVPENIRLRAEDNSMVATFATALQADGSVSVSLVVNLDRTFYPADFYPGLRDMYRRIIELQDTPLVFKRAK